MRALNDAKTHAQQGCAMQFSLITLIQIITSPIPAIEEVACTMHAVKFREMKALKEEQWKERKEKKELEKRLGK